MNLRKVRCHRCSFNVDPRPIPILFTRCCLRLELAHMPVLRVTRCRGRYALPHFLQWLACSRSPEPNSLLLKVDIVRKVVPCIGRQWRAPLCLTANHPPQCVVTCSAGTREKAVFELSKVTLKLVRTISISTVLSMQFAEKKNYTSKKAIWCSKRGFGAFVEDVFNEK